MMTDGGEAEEENREREVEQKHNNNKYSSIVFVVDIVKIEYENNKQTIYSNNTHVDE